jgi:hypothetical protein
MLILLKIGVFVAIFISLISLIILIKKTSSFGIRKNHSIPKGNRKKGIIYAFGKGMTPFEKESAKKNLGSYTAGILYHSAIFFSLFYLVLKLFSYTLFSSFLVPFQILLGMGFVSGIMLFLKRIFLKNMRALSCPDDYVANIIVNFFILLTLLNTFFANLQSFLFLTAILMFLYIPIGKIKHCVFFFYTRILFGHFYGRRGTLPPQKGKV